jgi:shikimate dehydrogenase
MKKPRTAEAFDIADLRNWSESAAKLKLPMRFGVIGEPIEHSLSPVMHNAALQACKIEMQFGAFRIGPSELEEAVTLFQANDFLGLNVTLPLKTAAVELMDELDEDAAQIGAINTVTMRGARAIGSNTDGVGFARAIRDEFSVDLRDLRILLIGAGGAAHAIAYEAARAQCERLVLANRTRDRAEQLAKRLQHFFAGPRVLGPVSRLQAIGLEESELRRQIPNVDLVVNSTPLGLNRSDSPILPARILEPHLMVFDTTYANQRTPLLEAASTMGARGSNGASMLLHQGARAFEIWHGREAPLSAMRSALANAH